MTGFVIAKFIGGEICRAVKLFFEKELNRSDTFNSKIERFQLNNSNETVPIEQFLLINLKYQCVHQTKL